MNWKKEGGPTHKIMVLRGFGRHRGTVLAVAALGAGACSDVSSPTGPPCLTHEFVREIATSQTDRLDLLFVVDDTPSMREAQLELQRQMPALLGRIVGREPLRYLSTPDVHVGIVSADVGDRGAGFPGCDARGDEGLLLGACARDAPAFVSFAPRLAEHPLVPASPPPATEAELATLACGADLGAEGCGFSQPLEAALSALWPAVDDSGHPLIDPARVMFADDGAGHGDRENSGFLRSEPRRGLSAIAIIVVSDQDDCSAEDPAVFDPAQSGRVEPAARCAQRRAALYPPSRYLDGLRALRPNHESRVVFGAITGVPELGEVDFGDAAARDEYYASLAADPRMTPCFDEVDGQTRLAPVCQTAHATARPAPRLVELARRFGENGALRSICADDWTPVLDNLVALLDRRIGEFVARPPLPRDRNGLASCNVVWELPPPDSGAPPEVPTTCAVRDFLRVNEERPLSRHGRVRCTLHQLAVSGLPDMPELEAGDGWFYDDFSELSLCDGSDGRCHDIFFTPAARPPPGVVVTLECLQQTFVVPSSDALDSAFHQPAEFEACDPGRADACARRLSDPRGGADGDGFDRALVCDPASRRCVLPCDEGACPDGWRCDATGDREARCEPLECRVPG